MFTELSLGCWSSGHRNLCIYQVSSSTVFCFVSYMHIHVPFIMYCLRLFIVVFQEMNCLHTLNMALFVGSQSFISLPSFMLVSAPVSEIPELNQNKKRRRRIILKLPILQLSWAYNLLIFSQSYLLNTCTLLEVPYTTN